MSFAARGSHLRLLGSRARFLVRSAGSNFRDISRAVDDGDPRSAAARVRRPRLVTVITLTEVEAEYLTFRAGASRCAMGRACAAPLARAGNRLERRD